MTCLSRVGGRRKDQRPHTDTDIHTHTLRAEDTITCLDLGHAASAKRHHLFFQSEAWPLLHVVTWPLQIFRMHVKFMRLEVLLIFALQYKNSKKENQPAEQNKLNNPACKAKCKRKRKTKPKPNWTSPKSIPPNSQNGKKKKHPNRGFNEVPSIVLQN